MSSLTGLSGDVAGDLLALAGAACMAGHWLCSRYARRTVEALPYTYLVYGQTALLLALMAPSPTAFSLRRRPCGTFWAWRRVPRCWGICCSPWPWGRYRPRWCPSPCWGSPWEPCCGACSCLGRFPRRCFCWGARWCWRGWGCIPGAACNVPRKSKFSPGHRLLQKLRKVWERPQPLPLSFVSGGSACCKKAVASLSPHAGMWFFAIDNSLTMPLHFSADYVTL